MKKMIKFRAWYHKNPTFRESKSIYWKDVPNTHAMVQELMAHSLDDVWETMQGENWSPNGEANGLIRSLGLSHTSMSVGDVIEDVDSGSFYQVCMVGFERF